MALSFEEQERIGYKGEVILDKWLSQYYNITDVSKDPNYKTLGIDRILERNSNRFLVEYKFDKKAQRTKRLFFETVAVDLDNTPGWSFTSVADYWIYLLPTNEVIVLSPSKFRLLVWQYRNTFIEKTISNQGYFEKYNTKGVCVPLELVRKISVFNKKIKADLTAS